MTHARNFGNSVELPGWIGVETATCWCYLLAADIATFVAEMGKHIYV